MRLKPTLGLIFAALVACAVPPMHAQSVPAAWERTLPLAAGGGISDFDVDWGKSRMMGVAAWVDYFPRWLPTRLQGLGIEAEARDLNFGRPSTLPSNFRLTTGGGGAIYTWRHFRDFRPYAKFLGSFGSLDFKVKNPAYTHDTRTVTTAGAGFEYRAYRNIWVRADYEYQFWPQLFQHKQTLDPQGITIGGSYHFGRVRGY